MDTEFDAAELAAFWRARLDEDEAVAKAAQSPSPWKAATHEADTWIVVDATGEPLIYDEGTPSLEEAAHIALHDPARALRAVKADRDLIAAYQQAAAASPASGWESDYTQTLELAVRIRVAEWSDHPDYREKWAPVGSQASS